MFRRQLLVDEYFPLCLYYLRPPLYQARNEGSRRQLREKDHRGLVLAAVCSGPRLVDEMTPPLVRARRTCCIRPALEIRR